jgi:hypothetical protein
MRIDHSLVHQDHTFRCVVTDHVQGWEVRREEDRVVVHDVIRDDWHRVERDLWLFDLSVAALRQQDAKTAGANRRADGSEASGSGPVPYDGPSVPVVR